MCDHPRILGSNDLSASPGTFVHVQQADAAEIARGDPQPTDSLVIAKGQQTRIVLALQNVGQQWTQYLTVDIA
jgi:hypothetical protein